jgi:hypothetical protein
MSSNNASCRWAAPPLPVDKFLLHVSVIQYPFFRYNGDLGKTIEYSLWSPILVTHLFSSLPHYIRYHHLQSTEHLIEHCSKLDEYTRSFAIINTRCSPYTSAIREAGFNTSIFRHCFMFAPVKWICPAQY